MIAADNRIEQLYAGYLQVTGGDKTAAASLTLADAMLTKQPEPPRGDAPLTVADVARRLGVSRRIAYELCKDGKLQAFRIGRAIRVKPEDLDAYIQSQNGARGPDPLACHRRPRKPRRP